MERRTPVRKSHTSTADLLVWTEIPPSGAPGSESGGPGPRSGSVQKTDGVARVVFGGQLTEEEVESVNKRKPCSGYKMREITGSGIFSNDGENGESDPGSAHSNANGKTGLRLYQQALSTMSQISFSEEESVTPKKPVSMAEVAKQRELCGNFEKETKDRTRKHISDAKNKELSGNDIFGPPEIPPKTLASRALALQEKDMDIPSRKNTHTAVKVSHPAGGQSNIVFSEESSPKSTKKIYKQKFAELSGNNVFKGGEPPESAERSLSSAKLKEMSGSDIFADGKAPARDYLGGVRKPPGGESSIALV